MAPRVVIQQIAGLGSTAAAVGKLVFVDALTWVYSIYLQSAVYLKGYPLTTGFTRIPCF